MQSLFYVSFLHSINLKFSSCSKTGVVRWAAPDAANIKSNDDWVLVRSEGLKDQERVLESDYLIDFEAWWT